METAVPTGTAGYSITKNATSFREYIFMQLFHLAITGLLVLYSTRTINQKVTKYYSCYIQKHAHSVQNRLMKIL